MHIFGISLYMHHIFVLPIFLSVEIFRLFRNTSFIPWFAHFIVVASRQYHFIYIKYILQLFRIFAMPHHSWYSRASRLLFADRATRFRSFRRSRSLITLSRRWRSKQSPQSLFSSWYRIPICHFCFDIDISFHSLRYLTIVSISMILSHSLRSSRFVDTISAYDYHFTMTIINNIFHLFHII